MPPIATLTSNEKLPQGLVLATACTPNGYKITAYLEKLKIPYYVLAFDLAKGEQKQPWFTKLNPNGVIPALLEVDKNGDVINVVNESVAILMYIGDKYDTEKKFFKSLNDLLYYKQLELLFFQAANLGPTQGQAAFYRFFCPVKVDFALEHYTTQTSKLYGVLEEYLSVNDTQYFIGDGLNVVDFSLFPWVAVHQYIGIPNLDQWPHLKFWHDTLAGDESLMVALNTPPLNRELTALY